MFEMKKRLITYAVLFVFIPLLTACNGAANAIVDYNNEFIMEDFLNEEEEYIDLRGEYEKVVNESNNDLEKREAFLNEKVLPKSQGLLDLVKKKKSENEELQEVHDLLVESEELRHESVEKELEAVQEDSQKIFLEAEGIVEEAEEKKQEFITKMDALIEEYDLEEQ